MREKYPAEADERACGVRWALTGAMVNPVTFVSQRVTVVTLAKRLDARRWRPQDRVEPRWYPKRPEFRFTRASAALRVEPPTSEQRWAATIDSAGALCLSLSSGPCSAPRALVHGEIVSQ